jgi:site-specific recombinase XerD
MTRGWDNLRENLNINCTPHNLRHSYATMLFDAGVDIKTAQLWLGHKDINTTLAIYTHLSQTMLKSTTKKFKDYLSTHYE